MTLRARWPLLFALSLACFSVSAGADEPASPPAAEDAHPAHGDAKRKHLILAGLVAASFLVVGAVAGRAKGGPASIAAKARRPPHQFRQ